MLVQYSDLFPVHNNPCFILKSHIKVKEAYNKSLRSQFQFQQALLVSKCFISSSGFSLGAYKHGSEVPITTKHVTISNSLHM